MHAYYREFFASLAPRGLSPVTIAQYARHLEKFADSMAGMGRPAPTEVTKEDIREYFASCRGRGMGAGAICLRLTVIKGLFRYLAAERLIPADPADVIARPRIARRLPEYLSEDEMDRLLAAYRADSRDPEEVRNRAILELMYASGLRVSEVATLKLGNLRLDEGLLRIIGKGDRERIVPVGRGAIRLMRRYLAKFRPKLLEDLQADKGFVFLSRQGHALDRQRIHAVVREAAMEAGIAKNVHPHTLRHTFATHLLAGGADLRSIQEMLGHADISTTELYLHVNPAAIKNTFRKYHPRATRKQWARTLWASRTANAPPPEEAAR